MSRKSRSEESSRGSGLDSLGYGAVGAAEDEQDDFRSGGVSLDRDGLLDKRVSDDDWPQGMFPQGSGAPEPSTGTSLALSGTLAERIDLLRERIETLKAEVARRRRREWRPGWPGRSR